jgi:peptidoglycan/LPS O-acetylase OafA/YrhL
MKFRHDINGLRALAVLAVMAFHFRVPGFSGGFVGVDVFFVISGFLMTGIIVGREAKGSFSVFDFYLDRGRRIVPALAILVVTLLAIGAVFLIPMDLKLLAKQSASAITFWSNILFWRENGYFDSSSETKLLLHTWSLSVEWQFYLLYPLMMLAILRTRARRFAVHLLMALAALSFVLCVWLSGRNPGSGFFLLPPRAWEMIAGGLVYLLPHMPAKWQRAGQLVGLALVALSILTASEAGWPGIYTLMPVVGTALVVSACRNDSRITGNAAAVWIGLRSYSIYLWHWPLAVLLVRLEVIHSVLWVTGAVIATFVLGELSYRFVESVGRRRKPEITTGSWPHGWRKHVALLVPAGAIAVVAAGLWKTGGLPQRFSPAVRALEADVMPGGPYSARCFRTAGTPPAPCIVGPGDNRHVLATLIGDSHSEAMASGFVAALPTGARGGVAYNGYAACAPLLGAESTDPASQCGEFLRRNLEPQTRPRTTPLVLVGYWVGAARGDALTVRGQPIDGAGFGREIVRTSCALAKGGPTYLMLPTPEFPSEVAATMQYRLIRDANAPEITMPLADYQAKAGQVIAAMREAELQCGVRLLDPAPFLCPDGRTCNGTIEHRAVFRDRHHLTEFGNKLLTPMFRQVFAP